MTKIIDNSKEKLASALAQEFNDMNEIAIASAYFNVRGYGALKDALDDKPLLFLLGREPAESIKWEEEVLRELEEKEDDMQYFELLQDAIRYFDDPRREVRVLTGPFFHGKAYIGAYPSLKAAKRGVGSVGSSNFTYGGLVYNRELNMLNSDKEVVEDLIEWFDEQWGTSEDFKDQFLSFLKNYVTTRSPYEVVAKALYETYKSSIEAAEEAQQLKTLYAHQILSYRDASQKLQKYGGVLIADATGLGKSRTALRLALDAIRDGKKALLIAPKSVLDTTWHDEMEKTNIFIEYVSSEKLSSDPDAVTKQYEDRDFIIVDEAHYFRHPSTNRYSALRDLIIRNKAQVVLASATPVNTGLMDLYFLFSLYLKEDSIFDLYGQTLRGHFTANQKRWLQNQPIDMEPVLERFLVRHSRELAKALDKDGRLRFPERVLDKDPRNKYAANIDYQKIDDILSKMNFAFYDLSVERLGELRLPDGTPISKAAAIEKREFLKKLIKTIIVINIFKRLESSVEAFRATITSLDDYMDRAARYANEKGYFVPPALKEEPIFSLDEEMPTPEELFSKPKYAPAMERCKLTPEEVRDFTAKCEEDRKTVEKLLATIPSKDQKRESFESRIGDIVKQLRPNNGLIVFSQYTTTAKYLYGCLRSVKCGLPVRLVTGTICYDEDGKSSNMTDVVREFQRSGGVLVSTDVLSAGQNLQNAQYVVNYDFPWNPVVLIQRVGRVDRMGSSHDKVFLINVLPKNGDPDDPSSLEYFIGLMKKLYSRLEAIRETIGLDSSTLGEEAAPKDFGIQEALARNDQSVLDILSRELEQFTSDPRDILARIMNERGLDWLKTLPKGIGGYKISDRDGLFILFTDGNELYWRLKYFDQKGGDVSSPSEMIDILLKGETQNKGENIDYGALIERMKEMKGELKQELDSRRRREKTLQGTPPKATQTIREIYDALANSGDDGERLANIFKKVAGRQSIVSALKQAMRSGNLVQKARELLKEEAIIEEPEEEREVKLTRVCWCWIQPKKLIR
jgi:hypothetical protein